jgi:DNA-binding transcriptional regulator YiaG
MNIKRNNMAMPTPASNRITANEKLTPDELTKWMNKHGISEKELAEIFGVTGQAVTLWLSGQRSFSVTNSRLVKLFMKHPLLVREF